MQDVLLDLQNELHKTIIFITHDLDEALRIGDDIAILRDGAVIQQGSPQEIVLNPADDYVRDFIKDINRARVLEVSSVMEDKKPRSGIKVDRNMVIEEALQIANANDNKPLIVTENDKAVGSVTLEAMIGAIARPEKDSERNPEYR